MVYFETFVNKKNLPADIFRGEQENLKRIGLIDALQI
jgi:hypothetical protein